MAKITAVMLALMSLLLLKETSASGNATDTGAAAMLKKAELGKSLQEAEECEKTALKAVVVAKKSEVECEEAEEEKAEKVECEVEKKEEAEEEAEKCETEKKKEAEEEAEKCETEKSTTPEKTETKECEEAETKKLEKSEKERDVKEEKEEGLASKSSEAQQSNTETQQANSQAQQANCEDSKLSGGNAAASNCDNKMAEGSANTIGIPSMTTQNVAQGGQFTNCQDQQQLATVVGGQASNCQDQQQLTTQNIAVVGGQASNCQDQQQQVTTVVGGQASNCQDQQQQLTTQSVDVKAIPIQSIALQTASTDNCAEKNTLNIGGSYSAAGCDQGLSKSYVGAQTQINSGSLIGGLEDQTGKKDCDGQLSVGIFGMHNMLRGASGRSFATKNC